ncbi:MAG: TetR/AcrR family transcriptional regulator [Myxococcota bacterium]
MARGRPKQYDEQDVLRSAADVFRERGFAGTSMQALSEAMQMGEQSIYNAFGNKQKVFERALDQYSAESDANLHALFGPDASLPEIEACLSMTVRAAKPCLVARTSLSEDAEDPTVARKLSRHMRNFESAFLRAIENAVDKGEIECDDPVKLARYLNMTVVGISVMARSGTSRQALRQMVDVSLQVVRGRPPNGT